MGERPAEGICGTVVNGATLDQRRVVLVVRRIIRDLFPIARRISDFLGPPDCLIRATGHKRPDLIGRVGVVGNAGKNTAMPLFWQSHTAKCAPFFTSHLQIGMHRTPPNAGTVEFPHSASRFIQTIVYDPALFFGPVESAM